MSTHTGSADYGGDSHTHNEPAPGRRIPVLGRIFATGCLALVVCGSSGCTILTNAYKAIRNEDCIGEFMVNHRNKVFAEKAYFRIAHCQKGKKHAGEFKAGFLQGYADIAAGGNGCMPSVAPSNYWGWRYQTPGGQSAVNEWFAGYQLGVQAAEQDGIGHWSQIQTTGYGAAAPIATGPPVVPGLPVVPGAPGEYQESGDSGVANPFYSREAELIPPGVEEVGPELKPAQEAAPEDGASNEPGSFPFIDSNQFSDSSNDLVPQSSSAAAAVIEAAKAAETDIAERSNEAVELTDPVRDIFGNVNTPRKPVTSIKKSVDDLPFTFE